jgi:hypothetical protein
LSSASAVAVGEHTTRPASLPTASSSWDRATVDDAGPMIASTPSSTSSDIPVPAFSSRISSVTSLPRAPPASLISPTVRWIASIIGSPSAAPGPVRGR